MRIQEIEGIGPVYATKLKAIGVDTTDALLDRAGSRSGRATVATETGITPKRILTWVNHADLMRLDGVGPEYADLLEAAGVDSCTELGRRNAANLAQTFMEIDAARPNQVRRVPSEGTVAAWIAEAKTLGQAVTH